MAEGGHDHRIIPKGRGRGGNITSALTQTAAPQKIGRHGLGPTAIIELVGSGAKKMEELVTRVTRYLSSRRINLQTFDFSRDMRADFVSTCEAVNTRLLELNGTYKIFNERDGQQLRETARQLREKQILISFVGHLNVGKSTLLNALLGARFLPTRKDPETSIMVHIHHDAETSCPAPIAASHLVYNGISRVPKENFKSVPMAAPDKCPKLLLEKKKHGTSEEVVGVTKIYEKLETLNRGVRRSAEGHKEVCCTLRMNIPLLANTPSNWQVVLVDTPGTGEFNSRVAVAAEGALKSSSAYVFITTYEELQSAENASFIQNLHAHDRRVFEDRRLVIVVTQFDRTIEPDDTDEKITVEKVQEKVCQSVREACPDAKISFDDVVPLSGLWAFQAQMLAMSHPDDEDGYRRLRDRVVRSLSKYQPFPCGQGESLGSALAKQSDDQLVQALLDASGLAGLKERIHNVTTSCITVWASKMRGDYERYLIQAKGEFWRRMDSVYEQDIQRNEVVKSEVQKYLRAIDTLRDELEQSMESTSQICGDLEAQYPRDLEDCKPVQHGKEFLVKGIKEFEAECVQKVKDEEVVFGPQELDEALREFLERMSAELEAIFNNTCGFTGLQSVVVYHASKMGKDVEKMRENARLLCTKLCLSPIEETEVGKEEVPCTTPSLGYIKDKVKIPPVSLSKFAQFAQWVSNFFNFFDFVRIYLKSGSKKETTDHENPTSGSGDRDGCEEVRPDLAGATATPSKSKKETTDHDNPTAGSGDRDGSEEVQPDLTGATATRSKSSSYRSWNKELECTMREFEGYFQKECDEYFATIKEKILKYFHDLHCRQTRAELKAFDADFKTKIDDAKKEIEKLRARITASTLKINKQKQLHDHLLYLKACMCAQFDDYVKHYK